MDCFPSPVDNNSSRKRKAEPEKWKRNLAKKQRYAPKTLPKRLLCTHKKTFKCMSLKMSDVKHFFESFYAQPNKQKQDAMLLKHCAPVTVKRRRNNNPDKAKQTFQTKFYIYSKSEKKKVQVCQRYFLTILQITKYRVQTIMKEYYHTGKLITENRGGDRISMKYAAKREAVMSFINKIPCEEPHYCRGNTKRYYLSSELSIKKLWKMYNDEAADDLKVKQSYFRRIFNTKYNLSFGTPRTDVCATCLRFSEEMKREKEDKVRVDLMVAQRLHKLKAKGFFEKVKEENTGLITLCFDCEKNLNLLKVPDQIAYYLRNVYLYNFTITLGSSKSKLLPENVFAYCWTEEKYPKAANEIASALYHRLKNTDFSTVTKVRLISDGCAGQNKNTIMLAMLSKWMTEAPQNVKEIEFIFPVVGHSYIPPDRVFGLIEKEVRKIEVINNPEKYLEVISRISTVNKLGAESDVFDWKTASQEVFKPVGNWHLKFKLCKRFILRRSKRAGNVLIGGHLHYKTDDGICKNVCKKGKLSSMINPSKINPTCRLSDPKRRDTLTLLKSHWGSDWEQNEELLYFKTLLQEVESQVETTEGGEGVCELQKEIGDMHV